MIRDKILRIWLFQGPPILTKKVCIVGKIGKRALFEKGSSHLSDERVHVAFIDGVAIGSSQCPTSVYMSLSSTA